MNARNVNRLTTRKGECGKSERKEETQIEAMDAEGNVTEISADVYDAEEVKERKFDRN